MRLEDIGIFHRRVFNFGDSPLVLIYGPNEAGKSTLLEAFRQSLFGFTNSIYSQNGKPNAKLRGNLRDGSSISFHRKRSRKQPVTGEHHQIDGATVSLDEATLFSLLQESSRDRYRSLFGFSLEEISAGEQSLKDVSLTQALLGASQSSQIPWARIQQQLKDERERIMKPRDQTLAISKAISQIDTTRGRLRAKQVLPTQFIELTKQREALQERQRSLQSLLAIRNAEKDRERLQSSLQRLVSERQRINLSIANFGAPDAFNPQWVSQWHRCLQQIERLESQLKDLPKEAELCDVPEQLIQPSWFDFRSEYESALSAFVIAKHQESQMQTCFEELPKVRSSLATACKRIGISDRAEVFGWDLAIVKPVVDAWLSAMDTKSKCLECIDGLTRQLESDVTIPPETLSETRKCRDELAAANLAQSNEKIDDGLDNDWIEQINSLTGWADIASASERNIDHWQSILQNVALPDDTEFDSLIQQWHAVAQEENSLEKSISELKKKIGAMNQEVKNADTEDVPTQQELVAARAHRDRFLASLVHKNRTQNHERPLFAHLEQDEFDELARILRDEDVLVDKILSRAAEFANREQSDQHLKRLEEELTKLHTQLKVVKARSCDLKKLVRKIWPESWKVDFNLANVRSRYAQTQRAISTVDNRHRRRRDQLQTDARIRATWESCTALIRPMLKELKAIEAPSDVRINVLAFPHDASTWQEKLEWLDAWMDSAQQYEKRQAAYREQLRSQKESVDQTEIELVHCRARLMDILPKILTDAMHPFLPIHEANSQEVTDSLNVLLHAKSEYDHLATLLTKQETYLKTLTPIQSVVEKLFSSPDSTASSTLGETMDAFAKLDREIREYDAEQERRRQRELTLSRQLATRESLQRTLAEQVTEREHLLSTLENPNRETLEKLLQEGDTLFQAREKLQIVDAQIADTQSIIEKLILETVGQEDYSNEQGLPQYELAEFDAQQLNDAIDQTNQQIGGLNERFDAIQNQDEIDGLQLELNSDYSRLEHWMERWMQTAIAELLLRRVSQAASSDEEKPLLTRVGEFLAQLTEGRYVGLVPDSIHSKTLAVLDLNGEEKLSAELSTGTREQLYLALRLGYIQQYCHSHEPLPVVMDDCFVNFDDQRLIKTLGVLREFAPNTQIILLSCHQRMREAFTQAAKGATLIDLATPRQSSIDATIHTAI